MHNQKQQFKEILQYAYSKRHEENITTQKLVDDLKERLQVLFEHNRREMK